MKKVKCKNCVNLKELKNKVDLLWAVQFETEEIKPKEVMNKLFLEIEKGHFKSINTDEIENFFDTEKDEFLQYLEQHQECYRNKNNKEQQIKFDVYTFIIQQYKEHLKK